VNEEVLTHWGLSRQKITAPKNAQLYLLLVYTFFGAIAILKELTPVLLKRTAIKWF
jgi:hypothetical protein